MEESCDNCPKRGQCCKDFWLRDRDIPHAYTTVDNKKTIINRLKKENWPFVPIGKEKTWWKFKCLKLGKDGKCTIYKDRPQLCKDFQIGQDILCYYKKSKV